MSYSFDSRIRYSEIGEDGKMTLNGILNYFQDCSIFHSEHVGRGLAHLKETKRVWVLLSWQVEICRYPDLGEKVTISTWPYDFRGFIGYRNFIMKDAAGKKLAWANSIWVFLDMETGRPVRLPEDEVSAYPLDMKLDMEYADRKIVMPDGGDIQEPVVIHREYLDTNHHVNNGQYVKIAAGYLPEDFPVRRMRAEYKKQALLGDVLIPRVVQEAGRAYVALEFEDGRTGVIIEFETE